MLESRAVIDFQVAFQGGGARLSDLLAAAEVLQESEIKGQIRVTRVAGTSAGALAAAIYACGGNSAKDVRTYLGQHGSRLVRAITGTSSGEVEFATLSSAMKLLRGNPLLNMNGFRTVVTEVLQVALASGLRDSKRTEDEKAKKGACSLTFSDVKWVSDKALFVVATDLIKQSTALYPGEGNDLVTALLNSSALPFAFRGHGSLVDNPTVDGGLCENLPSDMLFAGTGDFGQVLAISFEEINTGGAPEGLARYVEALVSTAINNSVSRAKARLDKGSVLELKSSLSTFDFAKAFIDSSEDKGAAIQLQTRSWIDRLARNAVPPAPAAATLEQAMIDTFQWYKAMQAIAPRRNLKSMLIATANCCRVNVIDQAEADGLSKEYLFAPQHSEITMFYVMVGRTLEVAGLRIDVRGPDGKNIKYRKLPALDRRWGGDKKNQDQYGYVLLFDEPLRQIPQSDIDDGLGYLVRVMHTQPGGLSGLLSPKRHDYITHENNRSEEWERVEVVVRMPETVEIRAQAIWTDRITSKKGLADDLSSNELLIYDKLDPSMVSLGWSVDKFGPGCFLRIDLYRED